MPFLKDYFRENGLQGEKAECEGLSIAFGKDNNITEDKEVISP